MMEDIISKGTPYEEPKAIALRNIRKEKNASISDGSLKFCKDLKALGIDKYAKPRVFLLPIFRPLPKPKSSANKTKEPSYLSVSTFPNSFI